MKKEVRQDKSFLNQLTIYLSGNIKNFFSSIDIILPVEFIEELEKGLKEIARNYAKLSLKNSLKTKYDSFSTGSISLNKTLGYEKSAELSEKALEYCFSLISEKEPKVIVDSLLKNESNFSLLLYCFENYLKTLFRKRFPFITNLPEERRDLLFQKILLRIQKNYKQFSNYDRSISKFRTYLFKAFEYSSYSIFREEGFEFTYYSLTKDALKNFIETANLKITLSSIREIENNHFIIFFTKQEIFEWFEKELGFKELDTSKSLLFNYVKVKSSYSNPVIDIENPNMEMLEADLIQKEIVTLEEKRSFIRNMKKVEKNSLFRLILKIRLSSNINYLNDEMSQIIKPDNINLLLLCKLNDIINNVSFSNNITRNKTLHDFFSNFSDRIKKISPGAIERRIYRCYEKISKLFEFDDFSRALKEFQDNFDIRLLESPPIFFVIKNKHDLGFLKSEFVSVRLRTIIMSDIKLDEIPYEILNLNGIEELDLSGNSLKELPEDIVKLNRLKVLDLRNQSGETLRTDSEQSLKKNRIEYSPEQKKSFEKLLPGCNILFD